LIGGPATLSWGRCCSGERRAGVCYLPGTALNKVREAYAGGEQKSDPKDAFVIADQLRLRWRSLQRVRVREEGLAELRVLVGHRKDLVQDQTPVASTASGGSCWRCSLGSRQRWT
jgi:Transposase